jgi:hypothetical protein
MTTRPSLGERGDGGEPLRGDLVDENGAVAAGDGERRAVELGVQRRAIAGAASVES